MQNQFNLPPSFWNRFTLLSKYLTNEIVTILTFELFIAPRESIIDGELFLDTWSQEKWLMFDFYAHINALQNRLEKEQNVANAQLKDEMIVTLETLKRHFLSVA